MEEQPSGARSSEAPGNREITTLNSKIRDLKMRLVSFETRIPDSSIISHSFWSQALAVFGHQMAIALVIYAIIFAIAIVFGILGAIATGNRYGSDRIGIAMTAGI
jgi:uncharacterized membrane protein YhaH (DUF805 family)